MLLFQGKKMVWPFSWSLSQKSGNLGLIFSTIFLLINNQLLFNVFPLFYPAATFEEGAKPCFFQSYIKAFIGMIKMMHDLVSVSSFEPNGLSRQR